ncbi:MAG: DUF6783 domain-containing protein [Ruminococcus sp.]
MPWARSVSEKAFPQSPTNCDAHLAESLFQTCSGTRPGKTDRTGRTHCQ